MRYQSASERTKAASALARNLRSGLGRRHRKGSSRPGVPEEGDDEDEDALPDEDMNFLEEIPRFDAQKEKRHQSDLVDDQNQKSAGEEPRDLPAPARRVSEDQGK